MTVDLALCIATCDRPDGLRRLLTSLKPEITGHDVVAIIVDNSGDGAEVDCATELTGLLGAPVEVFHQPVPGIPMARNLTLDRAFDHDPRYLVFVDDDERVTPGWLRALWTTRDEHDADVVSGPVLPELPDVTPHWLVASRVFDRRRLATGSPMKSTATNNTLAKAEWFLDGIRFDERLQFTGGSDTELFARMAKAGCLIVWSDEALVIETIPLERATLRWVMQRRRRVGSNLVQLRRSGAAGTVPLVRLWRLAARVPLLLVVGPLAAVREGRAGVVRSMAWAAIGWGVVAGTMGRASEEYRPPPGMAR